MLVEDDEKLRNNIDSFLKCKGYDVYNDMDFKDVIAYFDKVNDLAYELHTEYWKQKMNDCNRIEQY